MLKKSAALITCLMLALSLLVGCSGSDNAVGTAGNEEIEINVLSATMRLAALVDGWEEMIAKFEEENPGVKVNLEMQEWEAIPQYLAQARMAGEQIDIIRTTGGQIRSTLAPAGALMELSEVCLLYTSSLVLNNKPCKLSESSRQKILLAAKELNYSPNRLAVGLATHRTHTIGLIVGDISNVFFAILAKGVDRACPVSYTHRDVYKRQMPMRPTNSL